MSVVNPAPSEPIERAAEPVYITIQAAAHLVGVSVPTLYRWGDQDRTFPMLRVGATRRVHRARLFRWLDDRTQDRARKSVGQEPAA